jgi:protein TonB
MNRRIVIALSFLALAACGQSEPQAPVVPPTELAAVHTPPPEYPVELGCQGVGGTVTLGVTIGPGTKPTGIVLVQSSGNAKLDESAQKAVKDWDFQPATVNGQPVAHKIQIPVNFRPPKERPADCFQYDAK